VSATLRSGVGRALGSVPSAAWLCALVAIVNAVAWSVITPPFHVPDEPQHFSYTQTIVEAGRLPRPERVPALSPEEQAVMAASGFESVIGNPTGRPPWTAAEDSAVRRALDSRASRVPQGGYSNVTNYPPLYYLLEAGPYALGSSGNLIDSLMLMRLLSAILAGATVLLCFLFLREVLPGTPWAWPVGSLAAAVLPVFGFISGGVNNDTLLWTGSALIFLLLARILRRGLTRSDAVWLGAAVGLGICAKPNVLGFLPGIAFALLLCVRRAPVGARREPLRHIALAAAVAAAPVVVYLVLNVAVFDRPLWTASDPYLRNAHVGTNLGELLSYGWQLYLPRLPFMTDLIRGVPLRDDWIDGGLIGRFGWLDTAFPHWAYQLGTAAFAIVAAMTLAGLARIRGSVRAHAGEIATWGLLAAGLALLIAAAGYGYQKQTGNPFEQGRYLVPLLPLYAAAIALAARGAGARWGPIAGAVLVVLALAHGLFSQLLVISRFYG